MYLEKIQGPQDLKKLNMNQLKVLSNEIREELIKTVSKNGGHLASNLGVVELTIGLHYVFDSPDDSIIFDVGHQCYVHKLLTGRADRFDTIRKENGLSGFMNPKESEHDPVFTGHSSTAISAACGIAEFNRLDGNDNYSIAVVGDGAFTGGMTFEALNNSGQGNERLIVILNDNKMSISENVGSFAHHLARIRIGQRYITVKRCINNFTGSIPLIGKWLVKVISKIKTTVKNLLYSSNLYSSNYFESMGYHYCGPVDGNSIEDVIRVLEAAKMTNKPALVHAFTVKGKGFAFAEESPTSYHGVSSFDSEVGVSLSEDSFSFEFGKALCDLAEKDERIYAVTAAMTEGTGLTEYRSKYPKRFCDVGIAEQHAVTYSCGLAHMGMLPVFAVYSSFLQRGYDQIIHDAAIADVDLTLCIDRAGIVGEDGVTHQGVFDVAFLNTVPNVHIHAPSYYDEVSLMLKKALYRNGVDAVRYPRGKQPSRPDWYETSDRDYTLHKVSEKAVVVTYGRLFGNVAAACDKACVSVCKINRVKPLPEGLVDELKAYDKIFFYEEGVRAGGVAEAIGARLAESGYKGEYRIFAIDDGFVPHMSTDSAFARYGFDVDSIYNTIMGDNIEQ